MRRLTALVVAAAVMLVAARAAAEPDPPIRVTEPVVCRDGADPPHELPLAPETIILTPSAWANLDAAVRDMQEQNTRLTAENKSFRESASEGPAWWWVVSGITAAAAAGYAAGRLF